jgi:hypothetical membrane protein
MNTRTAAAFGLAAPVLYGATVILGGALWPQYSHVADPISLLTSTEAPNTALMNALFVFYDVALLLFGLMWWRARPRTTHSANIAALAVAVVGLLGIVMYFFRQDAPGSPVTTQGVVHIALAAAMSILTMLAIFVCGRADWISRRSAALYSFVTVTLVFVSGGLAAASIAQHWPFGGLLERCTIGLFQVWVFVQAWRLATHRRL